MNLIEKWKGMSTWQKVIILARDIPLYMVLLSALPHVLGYIDNSMLVLVCLPVSCLAQAVLSWKRDRKTAFLFLVGAVFVCVFYLISAAG